jgi:hypothetical protein
LTEPDRAAHSDGIATFREKQQPMKRPLQLVWLLLAGASPAFAAWPVSVCGDGIQWPNPPTYVFAWGAMVPDSSDGLYVRPETGSPCVNLHLDATGVKVANWPAVGVTPPPDPKFAVSDGAGGLIWVWAEQLLGADRLYALRWTAEGRIPPSWFRGVFVAYFNGFAHTLTLAPDGAGGVFVAWVSDSGATEPLFVQHVYADGSRASSSGTAVCGAAGTRTVGPIVADGQGGAIVTWTDARDSATTGRDIYAQRVSASLAVRWTPDGVPVCAAPQDQRYPTLAADSTGGAFLAWEDHRNDTPAVADVDVVAQHLTPAGDPAPGWPVDGVSLRRAPSNQTCPTAIADGAGGAFVAWAEAAPELARVYLQRLGAGFPIAAGWPEGGLPVGVTGAGYRLSHGSAHVPIGLAPNGNGGVYLAWPNTIGNGTLLLRLNADGTTATGWDSLGHDDPFNPPQAWAVGVDDMAADRHGGVFLMTSGYMNTQSWLFMSRFVHHVTRDGTVAVEVSLVDARADGGMVRLRWSVSGGAIPTAMLERRSQDPDWTALASLQPDGVGTMEYADRDVRPGATYGYRLRWSDASGQHVSAETRVRVPEGVSFGIVGAVPAPARGTLGIAIVLQDAEPAPTLELLDIQGRRVWSRRIDGVVAGASTVKSLPVPAPGVYRARLTQGRRVAEAPIVITR